MPGPSVSLTLFEPVTYLRGQSTTLDSSRERLRSAFYLDGHNSNGESQPSQLRGLVTLTLLKPTRVKAVEIVLTGMGRTDWPEGIGSNRLELAEIAPIIKEEVILFDARAEDAPIAPIRRANSVGPGVTGLNDDVDWSLLPRRNQGLQQQRSCNGTTSSLNGKGKDREMPGLARSVGKAAAKAGTAILPPTLLREIANSRPDKKDKVRGRSAAAAAPLRTTPPVSSSSRRGSLSHLDPFVSRTPPAGFDSPPPVYQPRRPSDTLSSGTSTHPVSNAGRNPAASVSDSIVTPTALASGVSLPAQSVSAAGPHGRSILHPPRRGRSPPPADASLSPAHTVEMASSCAFEARGRARDASEPSVRFDPKDLALNAEEPSTSLSLSPVASREQGRSATYAGVSPSASPNGHGLRASSASSSRTSKREPSVSAPTSRRPSYDAIASALDITTKGKGAGRAASGDSTPKAGGAAVGSGSNSNYTPRKPGLKSLLGGLRKEEGGSKKGSEIRSASARPSMNPRGSSIEASNLVTPPRLSSGEHPATMNNYSNPSHPPHQPPQFHSPPCDWREFKKGVYTYSISLPLPANLPPTIHADFGSNVYTLKAVVRRPGALTPNLSTEKEVVLIHAPDEEGGEETDAIVVERTWEDSLTYRIFVSGRSFACGSKIPLWVKFIPLGEKIRIWRLTVVLEEKTHYYAKKRKTARHETPRRFTLLKLVPTNASGEASTSAVNSTTIDATATRPLLPIVSDQPDALVQSPMGQYAIATARLNLPAQLLAQSNVDRVGLSVSCDGPAEVSEAETEPLGDEARQDALATLLDPGGPWELSMDITLPGKDSRINTSTDHKRSNITVEHVLRLSFRVEKARPGAPIGGKPMLSDIVIEAPVTINHSHTADAWLSLPNYWAVANVAPPTVTHAGSRSVPVAGTVVANADGKTRYQPRPESDDYFASSHYPDQSSRSNELQTGTTSHMSRGRRGANSNSDSSRHTTAGFAAMSPPTGIEDGGQHHHHQSRNTGASHTSLHSAADQWLHLSEESRVGDHYQPTTGMGIGMAINSMAAMDLMTEGQGAGVSSHSTSTASTAVQISRSTSPLSPSLSPSSSLSAAAPASATRSSSSQIIQSRDVNDDDDGPPTYATAVDLSNSGRIVSTR